MSLFIDKEFNQTNSDELDRNKIQLFCAKMLEWLLNLFYYLLFKFQHCLNKKHEKLDIYAATDQPNDYEVKRELLNKQEVC